MNKSSGSDRTGFQNLKVPNEAAFSPLLYEYLKKYQDDPNSRIFAPLAEAYRKAGMLEQAIEIAREGLALHPNFVGGRVALARALFDSGKFEEVARELQTVIAAAPDNLVAQRLYAESSLMLGRTVEALKSFKMLLFFAPEDREVAKIVGELEEASYQSGELSVRVEPVLERVKIQAVKDVFGGANSSEAASDAGNAVHLERANTIRKIEVLQQVLQGIERMRVT